MNWSAVKPRKLLADTPLSRYSLAMLLRLFLLGPFALVRLLLTFGVRRNHSGLFFFLPYYHVGGAEKVHLDVVRCFRDRRPWIVFTRPSSSRCFREAFADRGRVVEAPIDILAMFGPFYRAFAACVARAINRHPGAVVFGSNCPFLYALAPHLHEKVFVADLIHAFGGGIEHTSLPAAARLDRRVTISEKTRQDLRELYTSAGLASELGERITIIPNRVDVPETLVSKSAPPPLHVLYVGRGTSEKRVHLVAEIADRCRKEELPVSFTLVGDLRGCIRQNLPPSCRLVGELTSPAELESHYRQAHALLLVSSREGVPLVILEGMAHGVVPISTCVGGIPENVQDGRDGILLPATDEEEVVRQAVEAIRYLCREPESCRRLAAAAFEQARRRSSAEAFSDAYRRLLLREGPAIDGDGVGSPRKAEVSVPDHG